MVKMGQKKKKTKRKIVLRPKFSNVEFNDSYEKPLEVAPEIRRHV